MVMVLDNDPGTRQALAGRLARLRFPTVFSNGALTDATLDLLSSKRPDVIILDRDFGPGDPQGGDSLAAEIRELAARCTGDEQHRRWVWLLNLLYRSRAMTVDGAVGPAGDAGR